MYQLFFGNQDRIPIKNSSLPEMVRRAICQAELSSLPQKSGGFISFDQATMGLIISMHNLPA